MTRSCLSHSNFPLNRSVSRPACAFPIHLSIFKPKVLDISESEIRHYPLDDLRLAAAMCSHIAVALELVAGQTWAALRLGSRLWDPLLWRA